MSYTKEFLKDIQILSDYKITFIDSTGKEQFQNLEHKLLPSFEKNIKREIATEIVAKYSGRLNEPEEIYLNAVIKQYLSQEELAEINKNRNLKVLTIEKLYLEGTMPSRMYTSAKHWANINDLEEFNKIHEQNPVAISGLKKAGVKTYEEFFTNLYSKYKIKLNAPNDFRNEIKVAANYQK